ncbi:MAG TPA: CDP-alcohol phosphatidyltransferase family protein [Ignavibacteria bacterium]|nr:CDP-alcohol phosphatidyltransferase family protein [Ignavibacteria bacterium]
MAINKKELLYIPNLLSIFRLILLIPTGYLILFEFETKKNVIIALMVLMYVTDLLDGYIARHLNQVSETGKIIDPLADKISVTVIALLIFAKGFIPLWFLIAVITRDLFILLFGLYLKEKYNIVLMSNIPGKIAVFGIGLVLLFALLQVPIINEFISYFYYIILLLIIYSSILYFIRFKQAIGEKNGNH